MIELRGVWFAYAPATPWERVALRGVDLRIGGDERVLVAGGNGSGKTTLAWILAGILAPSRGEATLAGRPLSGSDGAVGLGFQHARMQLFRPTVGDDVGFGTGLDEAGVAQLLQVVGLATDRYRTRPIDTLSGGELRRVALAGLLARRPKLLVLDEPFAGLDSPARDQLVTVLRRLQDSEQLATLIVSHDIAETAVLADRAIVLDAGSVAYDGPVARMPAVGTTATGAGQAPRPAPAAAPPLARSAGTLGDLHLFRCVPRESPLHRIRPGTKVVCTLALALAAAAAPTWPSVAILVAVLGLGVVSARVPVGAAPRPPRWVLAALAVSGAFAALAGGEPAGLGGLLDWLRLTLLGVLALAFGLLLGWTTAVADLAPAVNRLLSPLRLLRLPVRELAMSVALVVRCLPLLFDEIRTLAAAFRVRRHRIPSGVRARIVFVHDLLVTALTTSIRRAQEMASAMDARGGVCVAAPGRLRLGAVDVAALAVTATAVAAMLAL